MQRIEPPFLSAALPLQSTGLVLGVMWHDWMGQRVTGCLQQVLVAAVHEGGTACCLRAGLALLCCLAGCRACRCGTGNSSLLFSFSAT